MYRIKFRVTAVSLAFKTLAKKKKILVWKHSVRKENRLSMHYREEAVIFLQLSPSVIVWSVLVSRVLLHTY